MKIITRSIQGEYFDDQFGHRGSQFLKEIMPNRSFDVSWNDVPVGTQSLALTFVDFDAIPVCGFPWIHWTVANLDPNSELQINASVDSELLEGTNSWSSGIIPEEWRLSREEATSFGGCAPPDTTHEYFLTVYALDVKLDLVRGFYMNELLIAMRGHILAQTELVGKYDPQQSHDEK